MEERMKKRAALCMLITLVDNNNGCINIGTDTVKRVFNDEDEVVKIEYAKLGTPVQVKIHRKLQNGVVVKKKFYDKKYHLK